MSFGVAVVIIICVVVITGWIGGIFLGSPRWGIIGSVSGAIIFGVVKASLAGEIMVANTPFPIWASVKFSQGFFGIIAGASVGAILGPLGKATVKTIRELK